MGRSDALDHARFTRSPSTRALADLKHRDEVCTAAPVWNELLYGYRRLPTSKRREELRSYLRDRLEPSLAVLPYDAPAADWHAGERARLGRAGRTPAFVDGQIAVDMSWTTRRWCRNWMSGVRRSGKTTSFTAWACSTARCSRAWRACWAW